MIDLYGVTVADLERDPYPVYKELRESGGVNFMPCLDVWMITSWAAVTEAATDPQRFPAHVERSPTDRALGGVSMMTTDGEPAKSRRRPFDPTFRPRAVEATMPEVFEELCDQHLDTIPTWALVRSGFPGWRQAFPTMKTIRPRQPSVTKCPLTSTTPCEVDSRRRWPIRTTQ